MSVFQIIRYFCFLLCSFLFVSFTSSAEPLPGSGHDPIAIERKLQEHIKYDPNGPNTIGHMYIGDHGSEINQATWLYVKNALDYYKKIKPAFIILELNTPGGEIFAAQKISDALKELDTQYDIPVVTYIDNWAISAGAMLAYSTRFIAVAKDASMGAAEPVIQGEAGEMKTASEKINSAIRADFANRARFFDRNPYLAEAMVDKDLIVVLRNGQIIKVDTEAQIRTAEPNPDILISPKGKLLTLSANEMMEYGVADILLLPKKLDAITSEEQAAGKWPASKTLLFRQPFFKEIPGATIDSFQMDWKMRFFALLASPAIASILVFGVLTGLYMEFTTPGFGVPGTVAVTCLILIILSSFSLEIANWLEVILVLVGIAILVVDLFLLPTFGLLGMVGILFFFAGLLGMTLPGLESFHYDVDTQTFNAAGEVVLERLVWLSGTIIAATVAILLLARYVTPSLAGFSRFILSGNEQMAANGYIAGENPHTLPQPGSVGEAAATLRPSGKILVNDQFYDAISTGGFIEKGMPIIVVRLEGSVIVVHEHKCDNDEKREIEL